MSKSKEVIERCLDEYDYIFQKDILKNKVAFITGGGSGICFTIAEIFMRHGCNTVILGRNMDRLLLSAQTLEAATHQRCLPVSLDVRQPKMVIESVDLALKEFGRIDYLINGAAGNFLCPLEKMSFNSFKTVIDIDTLGTFNVSKVVFDKYMKDHGGVIINITALLHLRGTSMQAHAGSAKAAIEALTKHMAVEWGQHGIRVMCVAPGPIADTEGMRRLGGRFMDSSTREMMEKNIPIQRMGTRRDIADICLFIVTKGGELLTGSSVAADGGASLTDDNSRMRMEMVKSVL